MIGAMDYDMLLGFFSLGSLPLISFLLGQLISLRYYSINLSFYYHLFAMIIIGTIGTTGTVGIGWEQLLPHNWVSLAPNVEMACLVLREGPGRWSTSLREGLSREKT